MHDEVLGGVVGAAGIEPATPTMSKELVSAYIAGFLGFAGA